MDIEINDNEPNSPNLIYILCQIIKIWMKDKEYDISDLCIDGQEQVKMIEIVCTYIQISYQKQQLDIITKIQEQFFSHSFVLTFAKLDKIVVHVFRNAILTIQEKNNMYKVLLKLTNESSQYLSQVAEHIVELLLVAEQLSPILLKLIVVYFQVGYEFNTIAQSWISYFNFITRNLVLTIQQHKQISKQPLTFIDVQKQHNQLSYQLKQFICVLCINCQYFAQKSIKCCLQCLNKAIKPQKQDMESSDQQKQLTKEQIIQKMKRKRQNNNKKMIHDQMPTIYQYGYNVMIIVSLRYLQQTKQSGVLSQQQTRNIVNNTQYLKYFSMQASPQQLFFFIEFATAQIPMKILQIIIKNSLEHSCILIFLQQLKKNSIQLVIENHSEELTSIFIQIFNEQNTTLVLFETVKEFQCIYAMQVLTKIYLQKLYKYISTSILSNSQWQSCCIIFHKLSQKIAKQNLKSKLIEGRKYFLDKLWTIVYGKINKYNCQKIIQIGTSLLKLIDTKNYKLYYDNFEKLIGKFEKKNTQVSYLFYLQTIKKQLESQILLQQILTSLNLQALVQKDLLFLACIIQLKPSLLYAIGEKLKSILFYESLTDKNLWFVLLVSLQLNSNNQTYINTYFSKRKRKSQYQLKLQARYLYSILCIKENQQQKLEISQKILQVFQQINPYRQDLKTQGINSYPHTILISTNKLKKQLQNYNDIHYNRMLRQFQKNHQKQIALIQANINSKSKLNQRKIYKVNHERYSRIKKITLN